MTKLKVDQHFNWFQKLMWKWCFGFKVEDYSEEYIMGCVNTISYYNFPRQADSSYKYPSLGKAVEVCYHYDTSKKHRGIIVRDDREEPFETIIALENGRYVLGTECQYSFVD